MRDWALTKISEISVKQTFFISNTPFYVISCHSRHFTSFHVGFTSVSCHFTSFHVGFTSASHHFTSLERHLTSFTSHTVIERDLSSNTVFDVIVMSIAFPYDPEGSLICLRVLRIIFLAAKRRILFHS